jgi:hypothetical protein
MQRIGARRGRLSTIDQIPLTRGWRHARCRDPGPARAAAAGALRPSSRRHGPWHAARVCPVSPFQRSQEPSCRCRFTTGAPCRPARRLALAAAGAALAQKTQLLVYTALETDQLKAYQEGFNKVHPDIEIKWVRDSTGVITAKLLAEKANPQADVVMGVAASAWRCWTSRACSSPTGR